MIEQYFDDPILKIGKYEFTLDEQEDLDEWFGTEFPDIDSLSQRELAYYTHVKGGV